MMTSEDITRVKRGPADLEERIEQLIKQKEILKSALDVKAMVFLKLKKA